MISKKLLENVISLSLLQAANYIFPLLTVPYLVRVLGYDGYGLVAFANALTMYIVLLSNYGFNFTATQQISISRESRIKICEIYSTVMVTKILLMLLGGLLMALIVLFVDKLNDDWMLYLFSYTVVVGQVIFPIWLFQGLELMRYITMVNVASKAFFTVLIFLFVSGKDDYYLVPLLTGGGAIMSGVWAIWMVSKRMGYNFILPNFRQIKFQLIDGWIAFYSSFAINLYTTSIAIILGFFTNYNFVGQFVAVDKIVQAAKGLYLPISQAVFPAFSKKFHDNADRAWVNVRRLTSVMVAFMGLVSLLLFVFSDFIVKLAFGEDFSDAGSLLKIMAFLPAVVAISNIFGVQVMMNCGCKREFGLILTSAAIIGVVLSLILIPLLQAVGAALVVLVVEIFVSLAMLIYVKIKVWPR
jgi:polysaccharide transporter, PST family